MCQPPPLFILFHESTFHPLSWKIYDQWLLLSTKLTEVPLACWVCKLRDQVECVNWEIKGICREQFRRSRWPTFCHLDRLWPPNLLFITAPCLRTAMSGHNFISAPCLRTFTPERHLLPPPANKDDFEKGNDDDPKDDPVVQWGLPELEGMTTIV